MGSILISNENAIPLEIDSGIYLTFSELADALDGDKSDFMREYRVLPTVDGGNVTYCDDPREFDAIRELMSTCTKLAAFAHDRHDGTRKPVLSDVDTIDGLELHDIGGILHVNAGSGIYHATLIRLIGQDSLYGKPDVDVLEMLMRNSCGRYEETPPIVRIKHKGSSSIMFRWESSEVSDKPSWGRYDSFSIATYGSTPRETAARISETLLMAHVKPIRAVFSFDHGLTLTAPNGLAALWADYATCFAKRPITICEVCGMPVIQNKPPRGQARQYCGRAACKQRAYRLRKKRAEQTNGERQDGNNSR